MDSSDGMDSIIATCLRDFPHISSLKKEQETCLKCLAFGNDVFAVLPTGFGKSLIFELFPRVMKMLSQRDASTVIVISPLVSIMKDQVKHVREMGISAAAIGIEENNDDEKSIRNGECEIVFGSPESWLSKTWTEELKEGKLGRQTVGIAFDEVHSVTGWGLSETKKGKSKAKNPFREAFGRVKDLRSLLPGIPMIALTATVRLYERAKLIKACGMTKPVVVDVSPNKENILLEFIEITKEKDALTYLKWIADVVTKHGRETPKTLIFCNTFNDISNVLSYLLLNLKEKAFEFSDDGKKKPLLGVYHAKMWEDEKLRIEQDFRKDGLKIVVIATCALGMGINFPNVRYVVHYGPPTSVVDLMQQAGRGGRDGSQAYCVTYFTRRQLSKCDEYMKALVRAKGCQRKELYEHFNAYVPNVEP